MRKSLIRHYGELVMSTMGARAFVDMGDATEALNTLRRAAVGLIKQYSDADRESMAHVIAVAVRTLDEWMKASRHEEARRASLPEGEREKLTYYGEDHRFFFAVYFLLRECGDEFVSLGRIADHVKATVNRRMTTVSIKKRLDAYVGLRMFQHAEDDPEAYRLAVRIPDWVEDNLPFREKLLGYALPLVHDIGYQVYVGARRAHLRTQIYEIPEEGADEFVEAKLEGYRSLISLLDEKEAELQRKYAESSRVRLALVFFTGETQDGPPAGIPSLISGRNSDDAQD